LNISMDTSDLKSKIENTLTSLDSIVKELKKLEDELIESEERFRLVAEFAYDWEYWQDPDGIFVYCSPSCETITGFNADEFSQNKELLKEIIHPDDWDNWENHTHEMSEKGEVEPIEFRIITKSGDIRWVHHVCRKIHDKNGFDRGVRGSNRDITSRKKMQKEIKILKGFLPICAACKKIRDDKGYWKQIESYIRDHSEAEFSHGICPDCAKKLYPDFYFSKNK